MFAKFKAKKLYAVQHSKFVEFTVFGTYITSDKDLIDELKANPRVEFVGEFETEAEAQIEVSDGEAPAAEPVNAENIKKLREEYKSKFNKKPDGKWTEAELIEKINEAPAAEPEE